MRRLTWLGWILTLAPVAAFALLAILQPMGDPQDSGSLLVRFLDYQGTYWMRHAILLPPPLLLAGAFLLSLAWRRRRTPGARAGAVAGLILLGLWSLVMLVPLLIHVN
jgi:Na+/proline symporter